MYGLPVGEVKDQKQSDDDGNDRADVLQPHRSQRQENNQGRLGTVRSGAARPDQASECRSKP